jgi:phage recombination protein Bet
MSLTADQGRDTVCRSEQSSMTTSQLATKNGSSAEISWTDDQKKLVATVIAPGCTADELRLFAYHCQRTGLDPFSRQIYAIKRGGKLTIQVSIDGLRAVAERTGQLDGSQRYWCGLDGEWHEVWLSEKPPSASKCVIYRKGSSHPFVGVALFRDYNAGQGLWSKMPSVMLCKCAEAQALRSGFPADLSGLYASEEMDQADARPIEVNVTPTASIQPSKPVVLSSAAAIDLEVVEPAAPAPAPPAPAEPAAAETPVAGVTDRDRLLAATSRLTSTGRRAYVALYRALSQFAEADSVDAVIGKINPSAISQHVDMLSDAVIGTLNDGKHPKTGEQLVSKPGRKPAAAVTEATPDAATDDNPFTE